MFLCNYSYSGSPEVLIRNPKNSSFVAGKKKKYYVVWEGHEPGIYDSWTECQIQIKNYSGARYKSYSSLNEAKQAFAGNYENAIERKAKKILPKDAHIEWESWSVDAACSGNPGVMEYRGVDTKTGTEIFRAGPYNGGTNNVGEFLALVHAIALLKQYNQPNLPIYSDSKIAMGWLRKKHCNTKLKQTPANQKIFELIRRAEQWLKNNPYENPILKWPTGNQGEIPADFGRK